MPLDIYIYFINITSMEKRYQRRDSKGSEDGNE
jgi:hypothetical protein